MTTLEHYQKRLADLRVKLMMEQLINAASRYAQDLELSILHLERNIKQLEFARANPVVMVDK